MITSWEMYWLTRLDSINGWMVVIAIISVLVMGFLWIPYYTEGLNGTKGGKRIIRVYKITAAVFVVSSMICTFLPSTKEMVAIYLVPRMSNNDQVQKLPENVLKFMNKKLETWIGEMTVKEKEK